jgi:hypothetical protein
MYISPQFLIVVAALVLVYGVLQLRPKQGWRSKTGR